VVSSANQDRDRGKDTRLIDKKYLTIPILYPWFKELLTGGTGMYRFTKQETFLTSSTLAMIQSKLPVARDTVAPMAAMAPSVS
jgi:hypothetical protein